MLSHSRINYPFIFEFDGRSQLDWRQLAQFPSFFLFLFGLFIWLNFTRYGSPAMYLYYPVILIFVTIVILFLPAPVLFHKSRKWFLYSHASILFSDHNIVKDANVSSTVALILCWSISRRIP